MRSGGVALVQSAGEEDCLAGKQTGFASANTVHPSRVAFLRHWRLYLDEGVELAIFMTSACFFTVWLFNPAWPILHVLPSSALRRLLMGTSMGATAVLIISFAHGKAVRCSLQPRHHVDLFSARHNRQMGCGFLRCLSIHRGHLWSGAFGHFAFAAAWPLPQWTMRLRFLDWAGQSRHLAQNILWPLSL